MDSKKVESQSSEPKRRGRKRKNDDDTSKPEIQNVVKGTRKREQKQKKEMKRQMPKHQKMWSQKKEGT